MKKIFLALLFVLPGVGAWADSTPSESVTTRVIQKGDPAPGLTGAIFTAAGVPAMNDYMQVAFRGVVSGTDAASIEDLGPYNSGIWADDGTGLQLYVQVGDPAAGTQGAVFSALSDPVFNNNASVAFLGTLQAGIGDVVTVPTTDNPVNNSIGIWTDTGLVARQGQLAPGFAAPVYFSSFSKFVLPDQGGVAFIANLIGSGIFSTNNQGIWAIDTSGNLQMILCKGSRYKGKTITALEFLTAGPAESAQTRSYAQSTGDLLIKCTFSDKSWGVLKVVFPTY
jgi:hypothetical protein